ncbi:MAG: hypothetical protein NTX63_04140 [Candidatus Peregrinibacteria bacterium]|nr:hypothetical protein [Candidatus Peregrinibacteria bacterium]
MKGLDKIEELLHHEPIPRALGIMSVPGFLIGELFHSDKNKGILEKYRADHEAGHALVAIFMGITIQEIVIGNMRGYTHMAIRLAMGNKSGYKKDPFSPGHVTMHPRKKGGKTYGMKYMMMLLAGQAAQANIYSNHDKLGHFGEIEGDNHDVSQARGMMKQITKNAYRKNCTNVEIDEILHKYFEDLREFFRKEKINKCHTVISEFTRQEKKIKIPPSGGSLNRLLKQKLREAGITDSDFADMKWEFEQIAINSKHIKACTTKKP